MKFYLETNDDLEGWDVLEKGAIQTEESIEDSIVATFFDLDKAYEYVKLLNHVY